MLICVQHSQFIKFHRHHRAHHLPVENHQFQLKLLEPYCHILDYIQNIYDHPHCDKKKRENHNLIQCNKMMISIIFSYTISVLNLPSIIHSKWFIEFNANKNAWLQMK